MKCSPNRYAILKDKKVIPFVGDVLKWAEAFQNLEDRRVAWDELEGEIQVSTVFLGLNHKWEFLNEPDLWFETMIFGGPNDGYQERYTTWEEAEAGHKKALEIARKPCP